MMNVGLQREKFWEMFVFTDLHMKNERNER